VSQLFKSCFYFVVATGVTTTVGGQSAIANPATRPTPNPSKSAAPTKSKQDEWLFVQNQVFGGMHRIYWTQNAIKIVNVPQAFTLVCRAPDWKLYSYRDDDKVINECSLSDFYRNYPYRADLAGKANAAFLKLESFTKDGLVITRYRTNYTAGAFLDLYLVQSPSVAPQVSDLLLAYYRSCPARGVVYRGHFQPKVKTRHKLESWESGLMDSAVDEHDAVVTTKIQKLPYAASDFDHPKGYKVVADGNLITTSKAHKKGFENLMDDMNVGAKFGTK
jgi:hypothetical protein